MSDSNSLTIFSRGSAMLAEANTVQKTKELKNLALTAADWAKRKGMGEEAIQFARAYALEAERKMGELLAATPRAEGKLKRGPVVPTVNHGKTPPTLAEIGVSKKESARAQMLAKLPEKTFNAIRSGEKTLVEVARESKVVHVSCNSGENEWYTPPEYIESARKVMGGIDCDPASSKIANKTVGADIFYDIEQDGLKQKWGKRVWMNPPYSQPAIADFSEAIASKYESGEVQEACVLCNNATETRWFHRMLSEASAVCFILGRIKFLDPAGNLGAPLQGQVVLYFGKNCGIFNKSFSSFGVVLGRLIQ